jgi:DNA protecting protein DprA
MAASCEPTGGRPAAAGLPAEAFAAALACLPRMGPGRLSAVLRTEAAALAWERIRAGTGWRDTDVMAALGAQPAALVAGWRRAAAEIDPAAVWQTIVDQGIGVAVIGSAGYPPVLAADIEPPAVVFHLGSPDVVAGPRVAVVGTRQCSATGAAIAWELGRDLAAAGVAVVSGLASGIDAAGHRGALAAVGHDDDAPPIGVVGSGLDVVYPRGQAELWRAVASHGVLLSEAPLGARPERWRFPARNRIIAALADLVVVVESHRTGGSMHTVDEADRRGIDVMGYRGRFGRRPRRGPTGCSRRAGPPCARPTTCWWRWGCVPQAAVPGRRRVAAPTQATSRCSRPWGGSPPPSTTSVCVPATTWRSWHRRSTGSASRGGWHGAGVGTRGSPGAPHDCRYLWQPWRQAGESRSSPAR